MKIGTKSVLFGAHCAIIHPLFVAAAWTKLYGFPKDARLWLAFFVHDLGYWGLPNMDGAEGECHVEFGAKVMHVLCDTVTYDRIIFPTTGADWYSGCFSDLEDDGYKMVACNDKETIFERPTRDMTWHDFSLYHSRFYAKKDGRQPSRLCMADKLACCMEPWWLYLPRVIASGEVWEYMALAGGMPNSKYGKEPEVSAGKYASMDVVSRDESLTTWQKIRHWHARMTDYMSKWAYAHKDGVADTWTPTPMPKDSEVKP